MVLGRGLVVWGEGPSGVCGEGPMAYSKERNRRSCPALGPSSALLERAVTDLSTTKECRGVRLSHTAQDHVARL